MIQVVLKYLGLDAETKRMRAEAKDNIGKAEAQLLQLRARLEETSKIHVTGNSALRKTLSESSLGGPRRRTAG
jgi:nitrate reductase assembly molybdenum cofactor insertion protein NarJ